MKADRHSRSEATAGTFRVEKYFPARPCLTFSAGEESEESAGVTPAEPVPGLDETLVLRLREEAGDEVGPEVGEPGVVHVARDDHIGPVTLAQREGRVHRLESDQFSNLRNISLKVSSPRDMV